MLAVYGCYQPWGSHLVVQIGPLENHGFPISILASPPGFISYPQKKGENRSARSKVSLWDFWGYRLLELIRLGRAKKHTLCLEFPFALLQLDTCMANSIGKMSLQH